MKHSRRNIAALVVAVMALLAALMVPAGAEGGGKPPKDEPPSDEGHAFVHVGTFDVTTNGSEVAEIVDIARKGKVAVYSDSATGSIGFVDISDPSNPQPAGSLEVGGEPTSVAVRRGVVLVGIDTTEDLDAPSGQLLVVKLRTREVVRTFDLGGQPDAIAVSPDGKYAAVVIENQRDEDENDGLIPQAPAGSLVIVDTVGGPKKWSTRSVDLTGLEMPAADDPEPEFVDIDDANQAVVSLQENNHLAVVDLKKGVVVADFTAGSVALDGVDATEEELGPQENGIISFTESIERRREPDSVAWIGNGVFATANEGDYEDADGVEGGSRGFTLFGADGAVVFESGMTFEYESARAGHYNEGRSANKGGEPESVEVGVFDGRTLLFVGAERANVVGVYDVTSGTPEFLQILPTGSGPEGMKAYPKRDLLVVSAENGQEGVFPSMITLYQRTDGRSAYPQLRSVGDESGAPIGWVAMSGMAGHPSDAFTLYGVSDSFLAEAGIFTIDVSTSPATITERVVVTDPDGTVRNDLDLEGIAVAPEGGFWVASEGRTAEASSRPNAVLWVDATGVVQAEVELPAELLAAGATSSGFEGLAITGEKATEYVYAVIQREWPSDTESFVKIARYEVASGDWTFVSYGLDAVESPNGGWVGLSEITLLPDGTFAIVERDNQLGTDARVKRVYGVDLAGADFRPFVAGEELAVVDKTLLADVIGVLEANSIWTPDKLEGLAVNAAGSVYIVTDNDGLDDAIGQTVFVELGPVGEAFTG